MQTQIYYTSVTAQAYACMHLTKPPSHKHAHMRCEATGGIIGGVVGIFFFLVAVYWLVSGRCKASSVAPFVLVLATALQRSQAARPV